MSDTSTFISTFIGFMLGLLTYGLTDAFSNYRSAKERAMKAREDIKESTIRNLIQGKINQVNERITEVNHANSEHLKDAFYRIGCLTDRLEKLEGKKRK